MIRNIGGLRQSKFYCDIPDSIFFASFQSLIFPAYPSISGRFYGSLLHIGGILHGRESLWPLLSFLHTSRKTGRLYLKLPSAYQFALSIPASKLNQNNQGHRSIYLRPPYLIVSHWYYALYPANVKSLKDLLTVFSNGKMPCAIKFIWWIPTSFYGYAKSRYIYAIRILFFHRENFCCCRKMPFAHFLEIYNFTLI